jgi:lipid A 3-O-deacylase
MAMIERKNFLALAALWTLLLCGSGALADGEAPQGYVAAINENDFYVIGDKDRFYTNGLFIDARFNTAPDCVPVVGALGRMFEMAEPCNAENNPAPDATLRRRYGVTVGQQMFTPEDISQTALIADDRPYAGYLCGAVSLFSDRVTPGRKRYDTLELQLGIIGEASLAEATQIWWHVDVRKIQRPNGWANQLRGEPALLLKYRREWPEWRDWETGVLNTRLRVSPSVEGAVGNVAVRARGALEAKLGWRLEDEAMRGAWDDAHGPWTFFGFASLGVTLVAHDLFLAGNTFRSSHSVPFKTVVGDRRFGFVARRGSVYFKFMNVWQSRQFDMQDAPHEYVSLTLAYIY